MRRVLLLCLAALGAGACGAGIQWRAGLVLGGLTLFVGALLVDPDGG
jgi:hypothetical protein